MKLPARTFFLILSWSSFIIPSKAVTVFYTQPYFGRSDSPFYQGIQAGTIYLEDFEDQILNTPYVTSPGSVSKGKGRTVDEDDGIRDGKYTGGYVWTGSQPEFRFSPTPQGKLPEYVGFALLGGNVVSLGVGMEIYSKILAYDNAGQEITDGQWLVLQPRIPILPFTSSLADRFAGIYYPGGISRIVSVNDTAIDHLQYGYAIPEPGGSWLLAIVSTLALHRRRRRVEPH